MCDIIPAMISQVRIQNLGKLADATVRIGGLTVLAGANSTGKSFFSKMLYSALNAMLSDHVGTVLTPVLRDVTEYLSSEMDEVFPKNRETQGKAFLLARGKLAESLSFEKKAGGVIVPLGHGEASVFSDDNAGPRPEFIEAAHRLGAAFAEFKSLAQQRMKGETATHSQQAAKFLAQAEERVGHLRDVLMMSGDDFISAGIGVKMKTETVKNFQVEKPGDLCADNGKDLRFDITGMANFYFTGRAGGYIVSENATRKFRHYSRAIYLDSPAFWRIQIGLRNARRERDRFSSNGREEVDGIPKYFYDLDNMLDRTLTGDVPFPQVVERIADVIGGKIVRDPFGVMEFVEKGGRRVPLPATAMGVANLGVLALVIERKLLDPGAFLFIDEPESNLHPEWQVEMTVALWELARGGVNVVIATHGVDILKRLDIYAKEEKEEAEKILAVNHFRRDGTVESGGTEKIRDVKQDLSAPFFKLYKRGLR